MTTVVVKVNVGGESFSFAESTLKFGHNKGSVLERAVSGVYDNTKELFLDVDPAIFQKYCAPFIRYKLWPIKKDFASVSEVNHAIRACNSIGLHALADSIRETCKEYVKQYFYIKATSPGHSLELEVYSSDTFGQLRARFKTAIEAHNSQNPLSNKDTDKYWFWFEPIPDSVHFVVNGVHVVDDEELLSDYSFNDTTKITLEDY